MAASKKRVVRKQRKKADALSVTGSVAKRASTAAAKRSSGRATATGPVAGPVTLTEARVLARARRPTMAAVPASPMATPGSVAAERRKLEQERRIEIARRVRDYKETMAIMKKRGARVPARARREPPAGEPRAAARSFAPLQIFAEGDSWFDYPPFLLKGGVIRRLEPLIGVPILNLAKAGDEVRYMLGVEERKILIEHLTNGCPAGGSWDVLLFSGGGNDIVGNPMALWINDWDPALPAVQHINQPRFKAALDLVLAGYEDLIALRNKLSPGTQLVFHGYDYAIPDGRGVCFNSMGPWLEPTFKLRGFPNRVAMFLVVKEMLTQFARSLDGLKSAPNVTFINAQGTLPEGDVNSWHNELHPSGNGFDRFAERFRQELKALFPDRVI
jgi:hypothetical protein